MGDVHVPIGDIADWSVPNKIIRVPHAPEFETIRFDPEQFRARTHLRGKRRGVIAKEPDPCARKKGTETRP